MNLGTKTLIANRELAKPWVFFIATYIWTWSFFGIAYGLGLSAETGGLLGISLVLAALSGPAVMAITFVKLTLNQQGQRDYWERLFDYKRISGTWYLATLTLIPAVGIAAAILSGYWSFLSFANVTPSLLLTAVVIPFVPLVEELGWRGYVLDRLQENYSALNSSLILGFLWGAWHLPAFFLTGGGLSVMPFASLAFWEYMSGLTALSICMTWIYNNTNRSTLSAVLFHVVLEFCADTGLFPWNSPELAYHLGVQVGLWALVALGITLKFGASKLTRNDSIESAQVMKDNPSDKKITALKSKNDYDYSQSPEHELAGKPNFTPYLNSKKVVKRLICTEQRELKHDYDDTAPKLT